MWSRLGSSAEMPFQYALMSCSGSVILEIARIVRSMISSSSCHGRLPVMTGYLSACLPGVDGESRRLRRAVAANRLAYVLLRYGELAQRGYSEDRAAEERAAHPALDPSDYLRMT